MSHRLHHDIVVIGSGPAGQKAAIQGAKAGKRVLMIEREQGIGGSCVYRGTIPSKTLRESALQLDRAKRSAAAFNVQIRTDAGVAGLMQRQDQVIEAHGTYMRKQLERNGVLLVHGQARFLSPQEVEVCSIDGVRQTFEAETIVIASGSRPRSPAHIPLDHEHILDSDSILSMIYLPRSLTVLGGGVIASEYASIFSQLGVSVTMIDRAPLPLGFLDPEIVQTFVTAFEASGGAYIGGHAIRDVRWDGASQVVTSLENGRTIASEKMLVALGRQPNVEDLNLSAAGLTATERGAIPVNEHCQTPVAHIYAVGDLIGPPGLASSSMEQGRRAACHALGLPVGNSADTTPMGIYTIPEISSVGLDEAAARKRDGAPMVGRARYTEIARAHIAGIEHGMLKLIADSTGTRLLGIQIVGDGACELIHVGQTALQHGATIDSFVDNVFNFPTLAEAYRVAALDILGQRRKQLAAAA